MVNDSVRDRWGLGEGGAKARNAFEAIRREVVACRIPPGATISEAEVCARFDLGRATCRVALQRLAQSGLAEAIPRQGYRIKPLTLRDIEEIFELRALLETHATRCAAGKVQRGQLARLEKACRQLTHNDIGNQIDFFLEANKGFHMAIAVAAGNDRLTRTLGTVLDEMTRIVALGYGGQQQRPDLGTDHNEIIDRLVANDGDGAARVAERHVVMFREMAIEKVMKTLRDAPEIGNWNLAEMVKARAT
ncbi:MAG: GntR family transcriptional regulator [Rhodobacterales bacterium]